MRKGKVYINVDDIIGKRLGKLEVVSYQGHSYSSTCGGDKMRHYYNCKCDCGNVHIVQRGPLKNDKIHSCGCGKNIYKGVKSNGNKDEK